MRRVLVNSVSYEDCGAPPNRVIRSPVDVLGTAVNTEVTAISINFSAQFSPPMGCFSARHRAELGAPKARPVSEGRTRSGSVGLKQGRVNQRLRHRFASLGLYGRVVAR